MPCPFPDTNNTLTPTLQHTQPHTLASIYVLKIFEWKKSIVSFFTISYFLLPAIACYPRSRSARFESYRMPVESLSLSTHTRALSLTHTHTRAPQLILMRSLTLTALHALRLALPPALSLLLFTFLFISFHVLRACVCMCVSFLSPAIFSFYLLQHFSCACALAVFFYCAAQRRFFSASICDASTHTCIHKNTTIANVCSYFEPSLSSLL